MIADPVLVQRPFVATPRGVRLCRPSEQVLGLLDRQPPAGFVKEDVEVVRASATLAEVGLRAATASDISAITTIYAHAVCNGTASYELTPPDEAEMARRFTALAGGGYPYLVAEQAGAVIGYAYASPFRPRPAYRFTVEDSVYLAPDMQGRAVGPRLMTRLIGELEGLGFRQVVAVIGDGRRNRASVRLARGDGFFLRRRDRGNGLQVRPMARHRVDAESAQWRELHRPRTLHLCRNGWSTPDVDLPARRHHVSITGP